MGSETTTRWGPLQRWFQQGGWTHIWHAVYVTVFTGATIAALSGDAPARGERVWIALLAVGSVAWYLLIVLRWRYWEASTSRYALSMTVAAALWFPLLVSHPAAFGWTVPAAYGVAACPWMRRSYPSIVGLSALVLLADGLDSSGPSGTGVMVVVGVGVVVLLSHATIGAIARESERRRRLIDELESTRAELAASERAAGAMAERERLAREIHDALAQGFISIVMLLEAADARLPSDAAGARAPLDQALQTARDSLAEARRIVWALGPEGGQAGAVVASLERLVDRIAASGDVDVEVVVTGEPSRLATAHELALLRTAQEALGNARRHAQASRITVTLSWLGDHVILDVADDGHGFDRDNTARSDHDGGFGLTGLASRARDVGGDLAIDSVVGEGTTVSLTLPVASEAADHHHTTQHETS